VTLILLVLKPDESPHLYAMIHDVYRFILHNRWILESAPLQLYCSALIFAPKMSVIRWQFFDQIPQWIHRLPEVRKEWGSSLQTLEGHSRGVHAVIFSPDGQLVASASRDNG
jgi:WD40 repeat protein